MKRDDQRGVEWLNFLIYIGMKKLLVFLSACLFVSCTQDDMLTGKQPLQVQEENLTSQAISESVTSTIALETANKFRAKQQTRSAAYQAEEVVPILSESGDTSMFVVNYANDGGFVIISATKNYNPVLAYAEEGSFPVSDLPAGVKEWVEEQQSIVAMQETQPDDSLLMTSRRQWFALNKPALPSVQSNDDEFYEILEQSLVEWANQGYEVYPITQNPGLPEDVYDRFVETVKMQIGATGHTYNECGFILHKHVRLTDDQSGPFIKTQWHQNYPYNQSLPMQGGQYPVAGCVAIATAQIMKYHEWPQNFEWSKMNYEETNTTNWIYTANLIRDVGKAVDTDYGIDESGADVKDAMAALKDIYNYSSNIKEVETEHSTIREEVFENKRPIIMSGYKEKSGLHYTGGHAWICDGFHDIIYSDKYILKIIPFPWEDADSYEDTNSILSYHYNWGWGENYIGWYSQYAITSNESFNYQYDQHCIINIYPNK